nr:ribonuclease H-like domain, reverse transcriptase, RNA-dependent DNA polymerase [Tanacetum cinerariifolium]
QDFTFEDELFFNTSCITRMTLSCCRFNPPNGAISWKRLKCLCLFRGTLDEDMIEKILSGSPCLKSLELDRCYGYRQIDVTSKSVKNLVLFEYYCGVETEEDIIDCIKINAPYILSLTIKGELFLRELVLLNVSSLVEVNLKYSISYKEFVIYAEEILRGLLKALAMSKILHLGITVRRYLQIVASIEQYSDLSEMTLEEAVGRLKTYKERIKYKKVRGFQTLNDLYKNTEELLLAEDEPRNYKAASSDQKWIEAIKVELDSINRNNTWELTTLPKGHKAIGLKWIFKTKKDANGNIIKHKARLVAQGYIQQHGIDFKEVFAPVARIETVRLLLAIAANNKWEVHHLDVKFAFLHGDLKE